MSISIRPMFQAFTFDVQWVDIFRASRCKWVDFDVILLSFEWDKMSAQFEIEAALLGFYVRVCLPLPETEESRAMKEQIHEAMAAGPTALIPLAEFQARIQAQFGITDIRVPADLQLPGEEEKKESS